MFNLFVNKKDKEIEVLRNKCKQLSSDIIKLYAEKEDLQAKNRELRLCKDRLYASIKGGNVLTPLEAFVKHYMEYQGLTYKELSHRTGYSISQCYRILNGKAKLTEKFAERLQMVTGFSADWFLGLSKDVD